MSTAANGDLAGRATLDRPEFYRADIDEVCSVFARMRREEPVFWYEPAKFWVLSKHEDQRYISSHPELFSSHFGYLIGDNFDPDAVAAQLPDWAQAKLASEQLTRAQTRGLISRATLSMGDPEHVNLGTLDPPRHGQVRKVFTRAFSPSLIRGLGPMIERIADDVLDSIAPGSVLDFVEVVAARIPALLITELADIPEPDREQFLLWTSAFLDAASLTPETDPARRERIVRWGGEFTRYLGQLLDARRANPGDDVISRFVSEESDGEPLTHSMAMMLSVLFVAGGTDSSRRLIAQIAQALSDHPSERAKLLRHPVLIENAVEEVLRYYPIVWTQCRTATERTEIRGRTIEKDDFLVLPYPSANRDEDVWDRPDEFDVSRPFDANHRHHAFGWGTHACPGASLARLEARVFLEKMLGRFPNWQVVGDPVRCHKSIFVNGIESMHVRFDP